MKLECARFIVEASSRFRSGRRFLLDRGEPFRCLARDTGRCSKGFPSYAMAKHAVLTSSSLGSRFEAGLSERLAASLVFGSAAPSTPVLVDNSEVNYGFQAAFSGSNTGTFGEAVPTRTTLNAYTRASNVIQRGKARNGIRLAKST